jgi:single-strand DNA-binding protein
VPAQPGAFEEDPTVGDPTATDLNLAVVRGHLSSDPVERTLPSGDTLWSYEISVRRRDHPTDTVPVVLAGGRAPSRLAAGAEVVAIGRVRRRFFRAGGTTASRTEIVADQVISARRKAAVAAALLGAAQTVHTSAERVRS